MSLTPIYDDLLREFEGIILVSEAAEAVQAASEAVSGDISEDAPEVTPEDAEPTS